MARIDRLIMTAVVVVVSGLAAGGCVATAATGVTMAAQKAWEDRSTEDQVTDAKITTGIYKRIVDIDKDLVLDVSVDVWEQRVMLTGAVDSTALRRQIAKTARRDKRIKVFHDQIIVVSADERDQRRKQAGKGTAKEAEKKGGFGQTMNDIWIETKIKGKLLTTRDVTSVNYFWRSVRNNVYIIGNSASAKEKKTVLGIIRGTDGVKRVKHFIKIKPRPKS